MAKTIQQLKLAVAGFLQRDPTTFVRGDEPNTVDLLLTAFNNARLYLERKVDLEYSRKEVQIPLSLTDGGTLANAVLRSDGTTPVKIKKLVTAYLPGSTTPMSIWSKKRWTDRVQRVMESSEAYAINDPIELTSSPLVLVQTGETVFIAPADSNQLSSTFNLDADAVCWLTNYTADADTDFVLDYCFDWMMYRSIYELNHYLKEDERVMISERLMADAWDAVVKWNGELTLATVEDVSLD